MSSSGKENRSSNGTDADISEALHRDELLRSVESQDLMAYGMIPEFVGRFPILMSLDTLDRDSLVKILTEPQDSLVSQYTQLFKMDEVRLIVHAQTIMFLLYRWN